MSTVASELAPPQSAGTWTRIAWHWKNNPKVELSIMWWAMVGFYQLFGIVFALMTKVMPPPKPWWDQARIVQWFSDNHYGLLWGFGIIFLVSGITASMNALIAYSMRRMSVSRAFAYSYLAIYSLSSLPGMLLTAILLTVGALRPDRDPAIICLIYDASFTAFVGTMGVFLIGTSVWMLAVMLDKNRVFPLWFGYLNICNLLTEMVVAPMWIFKEGPFAWNGVIAFWVDTLVFVVYTIAFIALLRRVIIREDFGDGALPDLEQHA